LTPVRLPSLERALEAETLTRLIGPIASLRREPLRTVGFTAARHERVEVTLRSGERRSLVVKQVRPSLDWTSCRTSDPRGREALLLAEPALAPVWDAFACPYLAFAREPDEIMLIMDDLSPHLFPDVREPLATEAEDLLLSALADLHARFWESPALDLPWLTRTEHYAALLDAECARDSTANAVLPDSLRHGINQGWAVALKNVPAAASRLLAAPATEIAEIWSGLPRTLTHGDSKVANFAVLPSRRVAAIDWAVVGAAPLAVDLGWYVAVNATRLSRSKQDTIGRYRDLLASRLADAPGDEVWRRMTGAAIVLGARMLLWSKALAVEADRPGARNEWEWWCERLEASCS
jgi:hypothetical protein